uniref:XRE family transcriptional regulator n=1 Tax=Streptomyces sp. NBC_00049 TaxID=2903617 RepID=A0AAU2JKK1_9ACTN
MRPTPTGGTADTAELSRLLRGGPFHLALRAALAARGLPLHRVQHRLAARGIKVGVTSLSYWQQGARRPRHAESLRAVTALEQILELPDGALVRLLTPEPGPGTARPASRPYRALFSMGGTVEQLLDGMELPPDGGLHSLDHHERVRIGPAGEMGTRESQQIVRAHRDGVDRYLAVHHGDPGCDVSRMRVTAYENCRTGRVRCHPEAGVVVAELLFDARLRRGDTYVFGYGIEDGTGARSGEYVRGFSYAGGQYMLQVRFDEAALPVRCRRFARTGPEAPRTGIADLTPSGRHRAVHLVEQTVRRGILGIAWDWD